MNDKVKYPVQTFNLVADSELRFGVADSQKCVVQLKTGTAEIFGMSLKESIEYEFTSGAKIAVFTWHGCTLKLIGNPEFCYKSIDTPMTYYLSCHVILEEERELTTGYDLFGPTTMITGPACVGKSSLCKMLLNWAVKNGRCPIYVDLDVAHGDISLHGTISAIVIEGSINVNTSIFGNPLILHFGSKTPDSCYNTFNIVVSKLAQLCRDKMTKNRKIKYSGLIINTPSFFKSSDSRMLIQIARVFDVSTILVLDQERLKYDFMRAAFDKVEVELVPKSVGIERPTPIEKMEDYENRILRYFHGSIEPLVPDEITLGWNEVDIFKAISSSITLYDQQEHSMKLIKITPDLKLLNLILSITNKEQKDDDIGKVVEGFARVINVDVDGKTITLMCPNGVYLRNSILLMNDY